jgi:hypothetical protein
MIKINSDFISRVRFNGLQFAIKIDAQNIICIKSRPEKKAKIKAMVRRQVFIS